MANSSNVLDWDSDFFGRSVRSLSLASISRLENELAFARGQGCQLIYIYSDEEIKVRSAQNFKILDVGGQIKFVKKLGCVCNSRKQSKNITKYTHSKVSKDILELTYLSRHPQGLALILASKGSFEELYKIWMQKQ